MRNPLSAEVPEARRRHGACRLFQGLLARIDVVELSHAPDELGIDQPDPAADVQDLAGARGAQALLHQAEQHPGLVAGEPVDVDPRNARRFVDGGAVVGRVPVELRLAHSPAPPFVPRSPTRRYPSIGRDGHRAPSSLRSRRNLSLEDQLPDRQFGSSSGTLSQETIADRAW